jgi:uncharacterized membrane protein YqgA involved in biofilm formation
MTGTIINIITVTVGSVFGTILGARLASRIRKTVVAGLGLFTFGLGIQMFLKTEDILVVLGSLLIGALLGEWWKIEDGLQRFGGWLEIKFLKGENEEQARFIKGFLTASLVFCVGPMTILGSIEDGLTGTYKILAVKATLDGFAALAFSSSLGIGVLFSIVPMLVYQGGITLLASQVQSVVTASMMNEMSAVGGLILMAIAISGLLEIKPIRSGNFLPALVVAPVIVGLLSIL